MKGNSNNMFKMTAKRRRSKKQIQQDKMEEARRANRLADKDNQIAEINAFINKTNKDNEFYKADSEQYKKMFEIGLLKCNDDGSVEIVEDKGE